MEFIKDIIGSEIFLTILAMIFTFLCAAVPKLMMMVNELGEALKELADASHPESDGGKKTTPDEWKTIIKEFKDVGRVWKKKK